LSTLSYGQAETRRGADPLLLAAKRSFQEPSVFFRSDSNDNGSDGPKLGFRSTLVLAKLGYDLREQYNGLLEQPMTPELENALERLLGPGADVETLDAHKRSNMQS
jgi:hypothetical protein